MKRLIALFVTVSLFAFGCSETTPVENISSTETPYSDAAFLAEDQLLESAILKTSAIETGVLTEEEAEGLVFMREEEKVARDIYIKLGEIWNLRIFANIQKSEQIHMNALGYLLTRYNIADPVGDNGIGVFTNPELQALYDELLALGSQSVTEALTVGKNIEIADIADLDYQLNNVVVEPSLRFVYTNLKRGSNFHLNAFNYYLQQTSESTF
ncbi:MAG: DUF2202 domain-containing protein [Ignavibacteriales bacterium]|nr:DUF2202 domain-containing protein [Ignavibacteriales bacterium]MCF8316664.1 DUF2202 domain-containing protein [Ignavibacteriales bacterium]MCF8438320.1 DUF2202 domain-containing protein [Ignavibacteriales bacterium]